MPFREPAIGGFLPVQDTREAPRPEDGGLSTAAKLGTVGAIGVGLYAAPLLTLGGLAVGGATALAADDEGRDAAFRTENTVGSFLSSQSFGYDGKTDESFDPWADIAGTEYEPYWDRFTRARNKEHADLIRADILREKRDREYLESQGMLGGAQSMAAGLFDLPSLLPGGAAVRSARGGYSVGKSALTVGAYGAGGAAITEGALQATQQLRTGEESAMNIAGATILSGVLGAGMASRMSRAELDVMGKRVEQEFASPRVVGSDQPSPLHEIVISENDFTPDGLIDKTITLPNGDYRFLASERMVQTFSADQTFGFSGSAYDVSRMLQADGRNVSREVLGEDGGWHQVINGVEMGKPAVFHSKEAANSAARNAMQPSPEITTSRPVDELEMQLRQVASEILPDSVRLDVVDSLAAPKAGDDQFSLRGFYSPAIRAAENISQPKGTGEQFWKQITKVPGVRKDELEWMGLEEFLSGKKSVTKDEVLSFMRAHQVKLDEKVLGGTPGSRTQIDEIEAGTIPDAQHWSSEGVTQTWSLRVGEEQFYIGKVADDEFLLLDSEGTAVETASNFEQAQHMAVGRGADEDGTKFSEYKVPGGTNYRELLIRLPELGQPTDPSVGPRMAEIQSRIDELVETDFLTGRETVRPGFEDEVTRLRTELNEGLLSEGEMPRYESPHFRDQEIVHLRVDDRTGPNGEKVLFINEVQSDLLQTARRFGFGREGYAKAKEILDRESAEANAAAEGAENFDDFIASLERTTRTDNPKVRRAAEKYVRTFGEKGAPKVPYTNDTAVEIALKRALLYAAENGYDAVSWARSDQAAKAVGAEPEDLALQYDKNMGRFLSKYTKKWGGKVEETENLAPEYKASSVELGPHAGQYKVIREIEGQGHLSDRNVDGKYFELPSEAAAYAAEKNGLNPILSITPAMRASVMEGQPLSMRRPQPFKAPEAKTADEITPSLKAIRDEFSNFDTLQLVRSRYAEPDLPQRFSEYRTKDTDFRAELVGGLRDDEALARFAELRDEGVALVNELRAIDRKITNAVEKDQRARRGEGNMRAVRGNVIEGKFNREDLLITISRAALDPVGTLHHEAVHALRAINLFTPREWKALTNAAKSKGWMDVPEIKDYQRIYGKPLEDDNIVEEAIAMAFQRHVSGEQVQRGILGSVFQRLKNFLERIAGVLKGQGMNTADDVFRRIREGDVAARAEPTQGRATGRTTAGAASAQEGDLRLKSAFGAEKAMAFLSPGMRLQNSESREVRMWFAELAETSLSYNDYKDWIPNARGGAEMGEPGSVETRVKIYDANIAAGFKALDNAFMEYRKGTERRIPGDLTVTSLKDATVGPPQDKMDYRRFREAVSMAMRRGDEHEIPQVAKAAKALRKEVFEPLLQRAVELEMLPEGITPETAPSYLNRMYNKERIVAERPQFKQVVAKWLQENEIHNEAVRGRLQRHLDEFDTVDAEVKKINARMKARAKRDLDKAREGQQLDEKTTAKDEADQTLLAEQSARQNELRKLIEEQIEQYQGKSAGEAKAAIEARRQVEAERDPDAARLRSADRDVMKAAKRIAAQVAKEDAELDTLADEIIDRILGTPEGRLPYDAHMNQKPQYGGVNMEARGPLAARQFMIPDERIEPWLENDVDLLMRAYVHTMAADTELTARFGSPDMVLQFKQINEEYAKLAANTDAKGRKKLHERKKNDFRDLAAIRDRIRGTYALPENPDGLMVRTGRNLMTLNYMRLLGGMQISAIPDLHRFIAVNGVMRTFGDGIIPMFRNFSGYKKAGDEAKWLSGALEMVTDNRAMRIADITDTFGRHTKFERSVQAAGRNFGMVSLMAPWNAVMKQLAGTVTMTRVLRAAEKLTAGKPLKQRDIEYMADLGISEGALRQIGEQFKKHGHKEGGVWFANTAAWDEGSRAAIEAMRVGLRKEADRIIVTPSLGEKPLIASTLTGAMLLQFKSFAISATQKMLVSGLQARDLNQVNGAALAIALGGLVHILKGATSGRDVEVDWDDEASVKQFMGNAFDRSGLAGVLMEFNNVAEKVTDGRVGLSAITGKPISRYASRNVMASVLGPAFGLGEDSFNALNSALGNRDWKSRDTHNVRQLLPYNNLYYLRSAFDQAEVGINEAFGVPER